MISIDKETYKLGEKQYIAEGTKKTRILIGNTFTTRMKHVIGWNTRENGNYEKTAMFTINFDGKVYQHFSPNYFSKFMGDANIDESSITILLENEGWLTRDLTNENKFINYVGHIYNRKDSVFERKWRNHTYWAPYTDKQMESTVTLVKTLCEEFNIPLEAIGHSTKFHGVKYFSGILYKSNFEKYYTDISPSWDCKKFKEKIEENG